MKTQIIQVEISSNPSYLGEDATSDDVDTYVAYVREGLSEAYPEASIEILCTQLRGDRSSRVTCDDDDVRDSVEDYLDDAYETFA